MKRFTALPTPLARRSDGSPLKLGLVLSLALSVGAAPLPVLAAPPPAEAADDAGDQAPVSGNIAILKFAGDDYQANEFRQQIYGALQEEGYTPVFIKRTIAEAATKNKCKKVDTGCLDKIGAYLNKNSKSDFDYFLWADVPAVGVATITVYDVAKKQKVVDFDVATSSNDYILALVIGPAVAQRLAETQVGRASATAEETELLASLDEPAETHEEIERRQRELDEAAAAAADAANADAAAQFGDREIDLKADFKEVCRTGPREDEIIENQDGEITKKRDLRPLCKRGPAVGYWQPRAWVALTLTLGAAAGMGVMYGLAAASRSDWTAARDRLAASGLSGTDPNNACSGGVCYADLAGDVSNTTAQIRRRAIIGDVLLGTTVLLGGVLGIIIYQDRQAAKGFLQDDFALRGLSNLRLGPVFGETNGAAMSFQF